MSGLYLTDGLSQLVQCLLVVFLTLKACILFVKQIKTVSASVLLNY